MPTSRTAAEAEDRLIEARGKHADHLRACSSCNKTWQRNREMSNECPWGESLLGAVEHHGRVVARMSSGASAPGGSP